MLSSYKEAICGPMGPPITTKFIFVQDNIKVFYFSLILLLPLLIFQEAIKVTLGVRISPPPHPNSISTN